MLPYAQSDGHSSLLFPDLCLTRFSHPTTFVKVATFGVTLGMVIQGEKCMRLAGHEITVNPAQLVVVTREVETESAVVQASPDAPYLGLGLTFGPDRVARALVALSEAGAGPSNTEAMPAFLLQCDQAISSALERLLSALADPLDRKLLAPLAIDEILFRLLRSDAAAAVRNAVGRPADANRIVESMQYINQHHDQKLTVENLARQVAMSPSHFAHRFRAVARISPMRYLREVRLDRARALLLENGARVGEVALRVGFESPAHFTREYKRRFGLAPSKSLAGV